MCEKMKSLLPLADHDKFNKQKEGGKYGKNFLGIVNITSNSLGVLFTDDGPHSDCRGTNEYIQKVGFQYGKNLVQFIGRCDCTFLTGFMVNGHAGHLMFPDFNPDREFRWERAFDFVKATVIFILISNCC